MAPSYYFNQWWLIINRILWHSPDNILQEMLKISIHKICLKIVLLMLLDDWFILVLSNFMAISLKDIHSQLKFGVNYILV